MESWTGVARSFVVEAWEQRSKAISNVDIKVTPFRARTIRREILLPVFPRCIERRQTRLASRENPTLMNADVFNQGDWRDLAKCRFGDRVGVREIRLEARFRWPVGCYLSTKRYGEHIGSSRVGYDTIRIPPLLIR